MIRGKQQTHVRHAVPQSHAFIIVGQGRGVSEDKSHRSNSPREKSQKVRRRSMGVTSTRFRRRCFSTCLFSLDRLNRWGGSQSYATRPTSLTSRSSGPENGSAHLCGSMRQLEKGNISTTNDESINNHTDAPTECPACDSSKIALMGTLWCCGLCGASGMLGGENR
jgi:hypothetical protein